MEQTSETKKSKATLGIIVGVLVFALAYFAVQQIFFKAPSLDKEP
jgi:hypothetical protein